MTDKERLLKVLEQCEGSIEDILFCYLDTYGVDFSPLRIYNIIGRLNEDFFLPKLSNLVNVKEVSHEMALYLKAYLRGDMYDSEEESRRNIGIQINNAQKIIDACKEKV